MDKLECEVEDNYIGSTIKQVWIEVITWITAPTEQALKDKLAKMVSDPTVRNLVQTGYAPQTSNGKTHHIAWIEYEKLDDKRVMQFNSFDNLLYFMRKNKLKLIANKFPILVSEEE